VKAIVDRHAAIAAAIREAMPGGVVILMGKGVERFQLIQGQKIAHSDHDVAMDVLRQLAAECGGG